jgi:hypothetical protein
MVMHQRGKGRERGRERADLALLGRAELSRPQEREGEGRGCERAVRVRLVGPSGR